jgi:hypothetical protein
MVIPGVRGGGVVVARMERSEIRGFPPAASVAPDFAALHPGYEKYFCGT